MDGSIAEYIEAQANDIAASEFHTFVKSKKAETFKADIYSTNDREPIDEVRTLVDGPAHGEEQASGTLPFDSVHSS